MNRPFRVEAFPVANRRIGSTALPLMMAKIENQSVITQAVREHCFREASRHASGCARECK